MEPETMCGIEPRHLDAWLKVTRAYLLGERAGGRPAASTLGEAEALAHHGRAADGEAANPSAAAAAAGPPRARLDSRGGRLRFLARVRQRLLGSVPRAARDGGNPLHRLEVALWRQVSFIAAYPEVPRRLLAWYTQGDDARVRRRIQRVIDVYASRLSRLVSDARAQGLIRPDVEPRTAASRLVATIQIVVLGARGGAPETLLARAERMLPACLDSMRAARPA